VTDAEHIRQLATEGDPEAQNRLGDMYHDGAVFAKDDAEAVLWYGRAAEQGYAEAQKNLGWMYFYGHGVLQDDGKAVLWYGRAAEQGYAEAQYGIGWMRMNGRGVPQDDAEAVLWYGRAAEQGYAEAQYSLSLMYLNGRGVPQDDAKAAEWCRKAATQGHADARHNLRWMYRNGKAVPHISEENGGQCVFKSEQAQNVIRYLRNVYDDELEFLWPRSPCNAIFRRKDTGKWYGALLTISRKKLGFDSDEVVEIADLRARPDEIGSLVDMKTYLPGYHMNKKHWYTVCLDGSVNIGEIFRRIDESYRLAFK